MSVENYKNLAEIFAFVAAGLFFIYKFLTGYFVSNLSISISFLRQPKVKLDTDDLIINATLSKGDRGSINLHDAQVRVKWEGGECIEPLIGMDRLSFRTRIIGNNYKTKFIDWNKRSKKLPILRLTPGEETNFSCYINIPTNATCTIELVVIGKKPVSCLVGQWRASIISLPAAQTDKACGA